jgi:hypothetical protein
MASTVFSLFRCQNPGFISIYFRFRKPPQVRTYELQRFRRYIRRLIILFSVSGIRYIVHLTENQNIDIFVIVTATMKSSKEELVHDWMADDLAAASISL